MEKKPEFALGDSSQIVASARFTILLVDTTCDTRTLHFAKTNYRYNFDVVKLESDAVPAQAYKAPGSFQEKGDDRQYSFIMYQQPRNRDFSNLKVPAEGSAFDAKKFQDDNGLPEPVAGVGMIVKLGGTANCDGAPPKTENGGGATSTTKAASSPSSPPTSRKTEAASSAAPSPSPSASPSASPSPASSSSKIILTPAVPSAESSASASRTLATTVVAPKPAVSTTKADSPSEATSGAAAPTQTDVDEEVVTSTSVVAENPLGPVGTSTSVVIVDAPSAPAATGSGNATSTGPSPALQTTNAAVGLNVVTARSLALGSLVALVMFSL